MFSSPRPDVYVPDVALFDFVFEHASAHRERPALIDGPSARVVTYAELLARIAAVADDLERRGVKAGDVVALYGANVPEYVIAFFAITRVRAVVTTVNPLYGSIELLHQLRDSGARWFFAAPELLDGAAVAAKEVGIPAPISFADRVISLASPWQPSDRDVLRRVPVAADELLALPYSSGTTGLPKGVMLTHRNIVANLCQFHSLEGMQSDEVLIGTLPFYHIYGLTLVMCAALRVGCCVVTLPKFTVRAFLSAMSRYRVTTAHLVPPLIRTLALHPLTTAYDLSALRSVISGGAPCPRSITQAFETRFGFPVRQAYGMTETSPLTHLTPRFVARPDSCGPAVANTDYRIVDAVARADLAPGQLGEVWIRGPQVMAGYLHNTQATERMIDSDGWLHTGDIGYADTDGFLYVVDRVKDYVKFRSLQYEEHDLLSSMVEDIALRRQATNRVEFQALLLDNVRESVVAIDLKERVTFWNKGAEALFGYAVDEAIGNPIETLIMPPESDRRYGLDEEFAAVRREGRWHGTAERRHRDGSLMWIDVDLCAVKDPSGELSGYIAIHRDVTELVRSNEMLEESREQMRNLVTRLLDVREQERTAISRELHDVLGQTLTRLKIDLCWMLQRMPKYLETKRSNSIEGLVDTMLESVRSICFQIGPPILDDLGLEAAIEWQAQQFAEWHGSECKLDLHIGALKIDRERDIAVFRIVQEALTNVARHARAKHVSITGRLVKGQLCVHVEDDGVGMAETALSKPNSLGLTGMRERAKGIGGEFDAVPLPGRGTRVTVRVPVRASRRAETL